MLYSCCLLVSSLRCRASRRTSANLISACLGVALLSGGLALAVPSGAQDAPDAGNRNVSKTAARPSGPNLLQNGDFASNAMHWTPELMGGKASGSVQSPADVTLPPGASGKVTRFVVDAIDKERWHVQAYQKGLDLTDGEAYTVTFWAKADRERPLGVMASVDAGDYHSIGLNNLVHIGTQWRKITLPFTATQSQKEHNRLTFLFGDALGYVDLADVRLQQGVIPQSLGANLLQNADFEDGLNRWLPLELHSPAQATLQVGGVTLPPDVPGKVVHVQVTHTGTEPWHAFFGQSDLHLDEEGVYTLTFQAKSDRARPLALHSDVNGGDFHYTGLDHTVSLTPKWQTFTLVFAACDTQNLANRLIFTFGNAVGDVDLAGVTLQRGAAERVKTPDKEPMNEGSRVPKTGKAASRARQSHPLVGTWQSFHKDVGLTGKEYQRYRFVFDGSGNGSLQVTTMAADSNAPPKSQQTEAFKWDLVPGGPHVSIGANIYTWTIEKTPEKEGAKLRLTLKNYEGKTYILFRQ